MKPVLKVGVSGEAMMSLAERRISPQLNRRDFYQRGKFLSNFCKHMCSISDVILKCLCTVVVIRFTSFGHIHLVYTANRQQ